MARVVVTSKQGHTLMDEEVNPIHLTDERSAVGLLERLAWAVEDDDNLDGGPRRSFMQLVAE